MCAISFSPLSIAGADSKSGRIAFPLRRSLFIVLIRFASLNGVLRPVVEKLIGQAEKPVDVSAGASVDSEHLISFQ